MVKKQVLQCAHQTEGACPRCAKPFWNGRPMRATYAASVVRGLDGWQRSLLEQYASIAGIGAAEVQPLEV